MRTSPSKVIAFDEQSLRLLETLCDSTWHIFETRHPVRSFENDEELKRQLKVKLIILAEKSGFTDLDGLQRTALEAMSRLIADSATNV
jgi:hypothetical protein